MRKRLLVRLESEGAVSDERLLGFIDEAIVEENRREPIPLERRIPLRTALFNSLRRLDVIQEANCVVAVAGMEGALASVIGGLVSRPVIAVPTSVGYGASMHGLSALLTMINSCANGIAVVNIDNGYGAGYIAAQINRLGYGGGAAGSGVQARDDAAR